MNGKRITVLLTALTLTVALSACGSIKPAQEITENNIETETTAAESEKLDAVKSEEAEKPAETAKPAETTEPKTEKAETAKTDTTVPSQTAKPAQTEVVAGGTEEVDDPVPTPEPDPEPVPTPKPTSEPVPTPKPTPEPVPTSEPTPEPVYVEVTRYNCNCGYTTYDYEALKQHMLQHALNGDRNSYSAHVEKVQQ